MLSSQAAGAWTLMLQFCHCPLTCFLVLGSLGFLDSSASLDLQRGPPSTLVWLSCSDSQPGLTALLEIIVFSLMNAYYFLGILLYIIDINNWNNYSSIWQLKVVSHLIPIRTYCQRYLVFAGEEIEAHKYFNLLKVTQWVNDRTEIQIHDNLISRLISLTIMGHCLQAHTELLGLGT